MKIHGSIKFFTAPMAMIHSSYNQLFHSLIHLPTLTHTLSELDAETKNDDAQIPVHPHILLDHTPVPGNAPLVLHDNPRAERNVFVSSLKAPTPRSLRKLASIIKPHQNPLDR